MKAKNLFLELSIILVLGWLLEYIYMGVVGLYQGTVLTFLEISLSFDNAVMNAIVLSNMSKLWRKRFITWGIIVAVFGVRFFLPVFIVSVASKIGICEVAKLAIFSPKLYANYLGTVRPLILSFGGAFLLMVFINWLFDIGRNIYWISLVERIASKVASLASVKYPMAILIVILIGLVKNDNAITISMLLGIFSFALVSLIKDSIRLFSGVSDGLIGFIYLELLDASCSLDGVVGAFAISQNIIMMVIGLGIGAFAIRSLTVYLVETERLKKLPFLEHGAHWSIGILGIIMLLELFVNVPEWITSITAILVIASSFRSSIRRI